MTSKSISITSQFDETFLIAFAVGLALIVGSWAVGFYMRRVESNLFWRDHAEIEKRLDAAIFKRRSEAAIKGHKTRNRRAL